MTPNPPPEESPPDAAPEPFGPLVGPMFWTLILLSLICIAAGAVIGFTGPRLWPARPASPWHASTLGKPDPAR